MSEAKSYSETAYDAIRDKIASGALPGGSLVSELSLANELNISRSPVREAVRRLIHEGLVEQVPRHGTIIRRPDRRDLAELYELREALESYAVVKAAQIIGPQDLAHLRDFVEQIRNIAREFANSGAGKLEGAALRDFLAADRGFHETLIGVVRNRRFQLIAESMGVMRQIFGLNRQMHTLAVVRQTCRLHARIFAAIRRGDGIAARRWMVRHLRLSKQQALEAIERVHAEAGLERNEPGNGKPRGPHCDMKPGAN
jgi:DNA-binding GntR family transcriptional regulator